MGKKDAYLARMFQMIHEAEKIISDNQRSNMLKKFGELLLEAWDLKKKLSSKVTNNFIDDAFKRAMAAGAYGGKLAGAGGGGFLLFVAPVGRHPAIREALWDMLEVDFSFENEGSKIIYLLQ